MKIAQVVCTYPPYAGGIANSAKQLSDILSVKYEVVNFHPATLKPWWQRGHGALLPQLLWKLRKFDYIYLHYPFFGSAEIVWLFKIFYRRPKLIIHYHMDVKNTSVLNKILAWPSRLLRRSLLNQAEKIISASLDYIANSDIKKYYQTHSEKFLEIPFALDLEQFKPKELNLPSTDASTTKAKAIIKKVNDLYIKRDRLDFIFIGGLDKAHYFKGVPILLQALANLEENNWHLKLIGTGDLLETYQQQAKDFHIFSKISFLGKLNQAELIRELQNSDVLVLPSINRNEAFGIVLIEALACGLPVLASDLPGVRTVFTDQVEGLLVEPNNAFALRDKLKFFLNNKQQLELMSINARRLAEKKYKLQEMIKSYENLFT